MENENLSQIETDVLPGAASVEDAPENCLVTEPDDSSTDDSSDCNQVAVSAIDPAAETAESLAMSAEDTTADECHYSQAEVQQMILEAEQRGYIKGCNEKINKLMEAPRMYEQQGSRKVDSEKRSEILILNNMRRSVWD